MSALRAFLAERLASRGMGPNEAMETAAFAVAFLAAAGVLTRERLDEWERDAAIYRMRGERVPFGDITGRYGISRNTVYNAMRRYMKRRRRALGAG